MKQTNTLIFKIGSLIILAQAIFLLALGFFYITRFSGEINIRFENQMKSPGVLMSKGLLRYETVNDRKTLQNLVGDSLKDCMIIGEDHKIYYSMNGQFIDKQLEDVSTINKLGEFSKKLSEPVFTRLNENGADYVICLSPLWFQNGKFLGYLYIKSGTGNLHSAKANLILIFLLGSLICMVFSSFVIIYLFKQNIVNKIRILLKYLEHIKNGDLTYKTDETFSSDEIGEIKESIDNVGHQFIDIISNINDGAEQVSMSGNELNLSSQKTSEDSTQLATIAEEVASSMEEMASSVQLNAQNAETTEKLAFKVLQEMGKVGDYSAQSLENIKNITVKISVINDIAFQTNILALNAAVEAARAGEYGKGFGVVATEVKKLAERCRQAANEINDLSVNCVLITEKTVASVAVVTPEIQKTTQLIKEISVSSIEQNSGTEQINNAIQTLNSVTQSNSLNSAKVAVNAEKLQTEADNLKEVISYFKT